MQTPDPPPPFPVLRTARLLLREITAADALTLFAIHGDAQHMRWFGTDPLPDLGAATELVARFASWRLQPNPGTRWGLAPAEGGPLLGTCGLFQWHRPWHKCALGYELAAQAQGQGYMREALRAVLDWGFEAMALNRVEAQVHPENAPSLKLLKQLGFVEEGRLRELGCWGGEYHDMLQLSLLRAEYGGLAEARPVRACSRS